MFRYFRKKGKAVVLMGGAFWSKTKKSTSIQVSNNDLTISLTGSLGWRSILSENGRNSGNFVFETTLSKTGHAAIGFSVKNVINYGTYFSDSIQENTGTAGIYLTNNGSVLINAGAYGITNLITTSIGQFVAGDVIAFAFNMTEGKCYIYKNGVLKGAYFGGLIGKTIYPAGSLYTTTSELVAANKASNFKYSYPGYVGFAD